MTDGISNALSATEIGRLQDFADKVNNLDASLAVFDTDGNCLLSCLVDEFDKGTDALAGYARTLEQTCPGKVKYIGPDNRVLGVNLCRPNGVAGTIIIKPRDSILTESRQIADTCRQCSIDEAQLESVMRLSQRHIASLAELLSTFTDAFDAAAQSLGQIEKISHELSLTYEELMLLYNMSTHMKVTQSDANYLQMACDQITQMVNVEGIAIFLEKKVEGVERYLLTAGSGLVDFDQLTVDTLDNNLVREIKEGKETLLDSDVDSPFKYQWPNTVRSIIAVPLQNNGRRVGLMVATNIIDKPDFDNIHAKLFNCVANQCAVFIENGRLFGDLKELFIGSLKALTNSIDAKDRYTRGHSERVAFISRWIAERLAETRPISDDQINHIYLAGLLHDIGKIGISEAVLCKEGELTEDERNRIKTHPKIGASILGDIKQMKDIVPGVLYHHERADGKGYPEGLAGDRVPLVGKIIGLADAFDAMTSKRIYRDALSINRAMAEIEKGLGTQFDEEIGTIFIHSDVRKLWSIIQDGFIESWDYSNFSEYGTVAVGTLIR